MGRSDRLWLRSGFEPPWAAQAVLGLPFWGINCTWAFLLFPPSLTPPDELQQLIWGGLNDIRVQTSRHELICDVQTSQDPQSHQQKCMLLVGT